MLCSSQPKSLCLHWRLHSLFSCLLADWDFIENGQDICHPDAAVLREARGTLHDDAPGGAVNCQNGGCGSGTGGAEANGYGDNLDCGLRIRAPKGQTINVS